MKIHKKIIATLVAFALPVLGAAGIQQVDSALPEYVKASGVSGNLTSVGSDTLANLMTFWAEDFKKIYPGVNIQIQAAGSSTAPPALTQGTATLGPMSRKMKDKELQAFEERFGYKPLAVPVAIDALAVFVHKDNPIKGLSMKQVDAIFSATRSCGFEKSVKTWGDLGLTADWEKRSLQLYGRNAVSGTYGYFKEKALCKGDFASGVNEQPGSASVVQSVSTAINAIGYSGIGYATSDVRALPLSKASGEYANASAENALNGTYPLARALYVYVNKMPNKPLAPMELEFLKFVLSQQGQRTVIKDGYIPLPMKMVSQTLNAIGVDASQLATVNP